MKEFSESEKTFFFNAIKKIRSRLPHQICDPEECEYFWCPSDSLFNRIFPGTIARVNVYKKRFLISDFGQQMPEMIVSTIAHELHHMWQFKTYGPLYFVMAIPVIRQRFLEKTAIEVEHAADKLMHMDGLRDGDKNTSGI